uniref:Ribosomal RNA large subunit methyltransferase K/L-like methyltransferase domain-containing protein n=1 Tax=Athene cunicularia TaxID=194338 RepID=A0A663MTA8_ATHCN
CQHRRARRAPPPSLHGKAFFSTEAELGKLRKLKSGERLFLLLKNHPPLAVSRNKDIKSLVIDEPKYWLDVLSIWKNIHGCEGGKKIICLKRRSQEETKTATKSRKRNRLCLKNVRRKLRRGMCCQRERLIKTAGNSFKSMSFIEIVQSKAMICSFLHSVNFAACDCSSPLQEMGRAVGIALMKQFGWQADLWDPSLEVVCFGFFPVCRLPLANREYIRTAGLRSTISWAMASLTEISAGAFVLDPMCGLGMILLEAAKEWPVTCYWGADISNSQLEGAGVDIRTAGLMDKIELLKASVQGMSVGFPRETCDFFCGSGAVQVM